MVSDLIWAPHVTKNSSVYPSQGLALYPLSHVPSFFFGLVGGILSQT
jgi:hypothetical protein